MELFENLLRVLYNEDPIPPTTNSANQSEKIIDYFSENDTTSSSGSELSNQEETSSEEDFEKMVEENPTANSRLDDITESTVSDVPNKEIPSNEGNFDAINSDASSFAEVNCSKKPKASKRLKPFGKQTKKQTKANSQSQVKTVRDMEQENVCQIEWQEDKPSGEEDMPSGKEDLASTQSTELSHTIKHKFCSLLRDLHLNPNKKFTIKTALTVDFCTFSDEALTSPGQIPKYILNKLMIVDYNARAFKLDSTRKELSDSQQNNSKNDENKDSDEEDKDDKESVNPMDAFLALFHCCDDFLRQDLAIKLSACQLSVPFLLPDPISGKITMLLWALDGIKKSWKTIKDGNELDHHSFVMRHPFPIVSFIRVGENGISKSKLLNKVISDINGHRDFFFHKDCKGGGVERVIVDGLVELCWYLPGGRKQQAFEQKICFANLRGDARKFRKQFNVLSAISSVMVLLLPSQYLDPSIREVLGQAFETGKKLVFVFNEKQEEKVNQEIQYLKTTNQCNFITRTKHKNEYNFVEAIRAKVQTHAKDAKSVILRDLGHLAKEHKIPIDYRCKTKSSWHKNVTRWLQEGPEKAKSLLKLQLEAPTIAELEREDVRPTLRGHKSQEEYSNEIYNELQKAKERQKESLSKIDKNVKKCLNHFHSMSKKTQYYSLTSLKHNLDEMSLAVLAPLRADYRQTCNDKKTGQQESSRENRLQDLETSLGKCSFGLEHIFREMSQKFQLSKTCTDDYADVAAKILFSGRSLELMDGDSSYIPLKWFNAVFEKLNTITKNKNQNQNVNIFVISVLGIQSSGKSTMLNTMFGLEFPVRAGRCTRGAFASLIPLSDSLRQESKYDYVLVIDTEGLRGSAETSQREHDNELATFAIGVADLTLVNIFGENYNEMKEFLEIAVHAFLKMRLVKEKRICQIVHQNVTAIDAANELATERAKLRKKLDEMTKVAATEENCESEFKELNDVLAFDENKDVSYIPSLLQGCPPMAPMNPEYGKAVQKVKEKITKLMCSQDRSPLSISQFQKRVGDLWKAILRENFIFSFRNTIEARAYASLDKKLFELSVKIMATKMGELEKTTSVSLMRSKAECRANEWKLKKTKIHETAEELCKEMEREMEVFFETNEDKATLEQWRENTMIKIQQLKENQENDVKRNCKADFDYLQSRQEIDKMKLVYKTKLLENAKKFILSVEANDDVGVRENVFEEEWKNWIDEVPENNVTKEDVCELMIDVLCHANMKLNSLILEKCKQREFDIKCFGKVLPPLMDNYVEFVQDIHVIRDNAIASAMRLAEDTQRSGARCKRLDLQQLYQTILDELKKQTENKPFKFKDEAIVDTLLHSFGKAYPIFHEMEEKYYREHDIKLDLETNLKPDLKNYFLNQCKKMKKEASAAYSFVGVVKKAIQLDINQSMGPAVANELLKLSKFQSKGQFHAKVLIELGEKMTFSDYVPYLLNPVAFLQDKLKESIVNYCIAQEHSSVISLLKKQVENKKEEVFNVISNASRHVSEKGEGIYKWIEEFIDNCSTLAITQDMFSVVTIDEELKDFEVFEDQVKTLLTGVFQNIVDKGVDHSVLTEWKPQPFEKLVDLLFGCDKCCPFCKALCDQTLRNHDCEHSTRNHRPEGITGYHYNGSNVLVTSICTTSVAGEEAFKNIDTSDNYHLCKEYRTVNDYYRSWSIAPDSSFEASSYWKWFMATYSNELAELYLAEKPDIPTSWKDISFDEAKEQIRNQYNLA